ncbi:MAG TPA: hypothetical protein VEV19_11485 [Ktedonobacteraceae bacterium]|nr:hypothetical protein [Ktedonobacteraceae bacterium]
MTTQPGKQGLSKRFRLLIFVLCTAIIALLLGISFWTLQNNPTADSPFLSPSTPTSPVLTFPNPTSSDPTSSTIANFPGITSTPFTGASVVTTSKHVSPLLFGTNLSLYDSNDQVLQSASTRSQLAQMHFRIIRMPVRPTLSNATEIQAAQAIRSMGAYALVVLRGAVDNNVLADDIRIIQDMNSVYGRFTVFYEYGNEEDLLGIDVNHYIASWNAIVPQLKRVALNGQFIGPVNYQYDQNYLATFLQNANPRPDEISWHEYTCDASSSDATCLSNIDYWTNHIANARATMQATLHTVLPIMITEWNYAPNANANDGKINDGNFMSTWTTKALQTLAANRIFASMQYTSTNSVYALVHNDGTLSVQGITIKSLYQRMILSNQQPTPVAGVP